MKILLSFLNFTKYFLSIYIHWSCQSPFYLLWQKYAMFYFKNKILKLRSANTFVEDSIVSFLDSHHLLSCLKVKSFSHDQNKLKKIYFIALPVIELEFAMSKIIKYTNYICNTLSIQWKLGRRWTWVLIRTGGYLARS